MPARHRRSRVNGGRFRSLKAALPLCAGLCLFLIAIGSRAETLRVTTWNLGFDSDTDHVAALIEAAGTLKDLAPDVILLQGVQNWHMCQQLAEALRNRSSTT